jgi:ubiquinone/menaquinone biosynthesis C-methylase UbiE
MTRSYFNRQADIWDERIAEKDSKRLASLAKRLDIRHNDTVLDVGTGTGVLVPFLLEKVGPEGKLVCLDSAEKMLAKARAKGFKGNIEYMCADICHTRFGDEVFDAVVCYSSFPHFQDKARALKEISRVLTKGGRLFICHTSSRASINQIHQRVPELSHDLIPGDQEMQQLLLSAGFGQISLHDEVSSYLATAAKL